MKIPKELDNKQLIKIIKKQIRLCFRYRYFRSVIYVSLHSKKNVVFEYIEFFCNGNWFIKRNITRIRNNSNEAFVEFKNGSFIRVVLGRESARGIRANGIVIDSDITNQEIIHCVLRPTLMPLMLVPPKWAMKLLKIKPYRTKRFKKFQYTVKI